MLKMSVPITVVSVKAPKDGKSNSYFDFFFIGGSGSIPVDQETAAKLLPMVGKEISASFSMRPVQVIRFARPVIVFEFDRFLAVER